MFRQFKYYLFKVLRQDSTTRELAQGVAVGVFVGLIVPYGMQIAAIVLAALVHRRFNRIAAFLGSLVTNPLTTPFVYYGYYCLAKWLVGLRPGAREIEVVDDNVIWTMLDDWATYRDTFLAMVLVAFVIAVVSSVVSFYVSKPLLERYRRRRKQRLQEAFGKFMTGAKAIMHAHPLETFSRWKHDHHQPGQSAADLIKDGTIPPGDEKAPPS